MNVVSGSRHHLVERAMDALGEAGALERNRPSPPVAEAPPPPQPAAPSPPRSPVIGLDRLREAGLVVAPCAARSRHSEEITVIQQQVLRAAETEAAGSGGRCSNLVLVTSSRPGEGKTFLSLNIAASIATAGARPVLLVDADGKPGSLTALLGLSEAPGLRGLAAAPSRFSAAPVVDSAIERLAILPYGNVEPGAAEVPPGAMLAAAASLLGAIFPRHIILLDSTPCLSTSDPSALAPVVGQVLMVVQAEQTQRAELEAALDLVDACPTLQLVLSQIQPSHGQSFGAYGRDAQKSS